MESAENKETVLKALSEFTLNELVELFIFTWTNNFKGQTDVRKLANLDLLNILLGMFGDRAEEFERLPEELKTRFRDTGVNMARHTQFQKIFSQIVDEQIKQSNHQLIYPDEVYTNSIVQSHKF